MAGSRAVCGCRGPLIGSPILQKRSAGVSGRWPKQARQLLDGCADEGLITDARALCSGDSDEAEQRGLALRRRRIMDFAKRSDHALRSPRQARHPPDLSCRHDSQLFAAPNLCRSLHRPTTRGDEYLGQRTVGWVMSIYGGHLPSVIGDDLVIDEDALFPFAVGRRVPA